MSMAGGPRDRGRDVAGARPSPGPRGRGVRGGSFRKPPLRIFTTTLWEYPSQHYDSASVPGKQVGAGSGREAGATQGDFTVGSGRAPTASASNYEVNFGHEAKRGQVLMTVEIDDSQARADWGWRPEYDLPAMVDDMLRGLAEKLSTGSGAAGPAHR